MKNIVKTALLFLVSASLWSCYEGYTDDFGYSTTQFAQQRPLRTVVADRDGIESEIYVGVSIGGKREVDMSDWATFEIDPSLVPAGKTLLPATHYVLGDPNTMRVRKANLPVADVKITFTEDFYNDPLSLANTYVLPFKLTGSSCDQTPEGKDFSLVCIKFVSSFSGTYYIIGKKTQVADAAGTEMPGGTVTVYDNKAGISQNPTRALATVSRSEVRRAGVAEMPANNNYRAMFTMTPAADGSDHDYDVAVTTGGGVSITAGTGEFYDAPFDASGITNQARFEVSYIYQDGTNYYKVDEILYRRRDPYLDLRVETW